MNTFGLLLVLLCCFAVCLPARTQTPPAQTASVYLLKPAHVFDGESAELHDGWAVLVRGERIEAVGPAATINAPADAKVIEMPGTTLMPGLIDAHSHVLLHPYSETVWNDQVARESGRLAAASRPSINGPPSRRNPIFSSTVSIWSALRS